MPALQIADRLLTDGATSGASTFVVDYSLRDGATVADVSVVVRRDPAASAAGAFVVVAIINSVAGAAEFVGGAPVSTTRAVSAELASCSVVVSLSGSSLRLTCAGVVGEELVWQLSMRAEVC